MFELIIYYIQALTACKEDTPSQFCLNAPSSLLRNESMKTLNHLYSEEIAQQINQQNLAALDRIESQQAALANHLEALQKTLARIDKKIIPPRFKLIGSRFLYIEHNVWHNWNTASTICRQRGGHIASFQGEKDLKFVYSKVYRYSPYWLVTSNTSLPLDNPASGNCFVLYEDAVLDKRCADFAYFICETENYME